LSKLRGRSSGEVRALLRKAVQSATVCGACFRPLAATDSVTIGRNIGSHRKPQLSRVPVCLLCTLTVMKPLMDHDHPHFLYGRFIRARCLNCGRPLRLNPQLWYGARVCCSNCGRLARNKRNAERRRVEHQPIKCAVCRKPFVPTRSDAVTCSNTCRQAQHRQRTSAAHRQS
jgi:hypothetical protein